MKYHIFVGRLGNGHAALAKHLVNVLNYTPDQTKNAVLIHWGSYANWSKDAQDATSVESLLQKVDNTIANNSYTDVVIVGPWVLENITALSQIGPRTEYWIDRIDTTESRFKSRKFVRGKSNFDNGPDTEFQDWQDHQNDIWADVSPISNWTPINGFHWDLVESKIAIIASHNTAQYVRQCHIKQID